MVRSLWTVHNDHGAQLTFQNGRHPREGGTFPTLGSWVTYGLATVNQNLPGFMGPTRGDTSPRTPIGIAVVVLGLLALGGAALIVRRGRPGGSD